MIKSNKKPSPACTFPEQPSERKIPLGRLLHKSSRFFSELAAQKLAQAGYAHIWIGHIVLLLHIRPEGSTINQLAQKTNLTKQAASRFIRELESGHYVLTHKHPNDARSVLVGITASGYQLLEAWETATARVYQQLAAVVGETALNDLSTTLEKLVTFFRNQPNGSPG